MSGPGCTASSVDWKQARGHWLGMGSTCAFVDSAVPISLEHPPVIAPQLQARTEAAFLVQEPADLGTEPPSRAPVLPMDFHLLKSQPPDSAPTTQRDSEQSKRNSKRKHPSHLPFQLQAEWGSVATCSRCAETKVISSSWLPLVIPGDAQFNGGTNAQRRAVLNKWYRRFCSTHSTAVFYFTRPGSHRKKRGTVWYMPSPMGTAK